MVNILMFIGFMVIGLSMLTVSTLSACTVRPTRRTLRMGRLPLDWTKHAPIRSRCGKCSACLYTHCSACGKRTTDCECTACSVCGIHTTKCTCSICGNCGTKGVCWCTHCGYCGEYNTDCDCTTCSACGGNQHICRCGNDIGTVRTELALIGHKVGKHKLGGGVLTACYNDEGDNRYVYLFTKNDAVDKDVIISGRQRSDAVRMHTVDIQPLGYVGSGVYKAYRIERIAVGEDWDTACKLSSALPYWVHDWDIKHLKYVKRTISASMARALITLVNEYKRHGTPVDKLRFDFHGGNYGVSTDGRFILLDAFYEGNG